MFAANYTFSSSESNTTGAFGIPANGDDLTTEWGVQAPRHRVGGIFNTSPIRNLTVGLNFRAQSGMPYNVTTGVDVNGDGVFNDRPAGVGRNSASTARSGISGCAWPTRSASARAPRPAVPAAARWSS